MIIYPITLKASGTVPNTIRLISVENTTRKSTAKAIRKKSEMNPMESITRTAEAAALYAAPEIVTTAQASQ